MHPSGKDLAQLADLIARGSLRVIIDKIYPFAAIAEAVAYLRPVAPRARSSSCHPNHKRPLDQTNREPRVPQMTELKAARA